MPRLELSRAVAFSSGHRYWRADLDAVDNRALFGKWASPFNHGHDYRLWVSVSGVASLVHGMVVNIKTIDSWLKSRVVEAYDQRSINDEVPGFATKAPSLENILADVRERLADPPSGCFLARLELEESPTLRAAWQGKQPDIVIIARTYEFAASHRLHAEALTAEQNLELFGKCNHAAGHGHNYLLEVSLSGKADPTSGMVASLEDLDAIVEREILDRYDHRNLNVDVPELEGKVTTSENVALAIFARLEPLVPARLEKVVLYETARNRFEVSRDAD